MSIIDPMIEEFTHEAATTRKLLERAPEKDFAWKPHEKSMSLGRLVSHLADTPEWAVTILDRDEVDIDPSTRKPWVAQSLAEALAKFDAGVKQAVAAMKGQSDERMLQPWTLKTMGQTVFTLPRAAVLRTFVISHQIHHRAQLGLYLRLRDVPLPSVYGPTADEQGSG